jgi:hypothetical protein
MMVTMSTNSVSELRRIAEAVGHLRDRTVLDVVIRSDCRQLRVILDDERTVLVSVLLDETGRPRLDVDVLRPPAERATAQLEVRFEVGA